MSTSSTPNLRPAGNTEQTWCKAVPTGTGITIQALLFSTPPNPKTLQTLLQNLHPILNSKLQYNPISNTFSFLTPPTPHLHLQTSPLPFPSLSLVLEHELNINPWINPDTETDVFYATLYDLVEENGDGKWVLALRLHTSVCDRVGCVALLEEVVKGMGGGEMGNVGGEGSFGIEEYVPKRVGRKGFWARGVDLVGYSLNSFRLSNLGFVDCVSSGRESRVVRFVFGGEDTERILSSCESKEIKLCSLLAAAGLIAAHSLKGLPDDHWEKYSVTTLLDCRSLLEPPLSSHHIGFYHSAIVNTHDVKGGENLWELAKRVHSSFQNAKDNNKHFSDMADLNFLMCKAIANPSLTPSGSLRTSLISVFEDPVIDHSNKTHQLIGLEDSIGCGSVHGVGPSLAIFDTIRDRKLDCTCVYPFPLHSREQMQEFVDEMKRIVLDGTTLME